MSGGSDTLPETQGTFQLTAKSPLFSAKAYSHALWSSPWQKTG
jgi:hypothetical protein